MDRINLNSNPSPSLPPLPEGLESALKRGHTLQVDGTNVVRVPFGVRQARRSRPANPLIGTLWSSLCSLLERQRPHRLQPEDHATLISIDS